MRETILHYIEGLGWLSPELVVLLLAMLPIFELRGSVPVGIILFKLPVLETAFYSILGNMLPIVILLLLFDPVYQWLSRYPRIDRLFQWVFKRTRRKGKLIERLEVVGLVLFVSIPLPVTGAWSPTETKPPGFAMSCPRFTSSPACTSAFDGAPICWLRGSTYSSTKGSRSIGSAHVASLCS